jgi:hypothetical protein
MILLAYLSHISKPSVYVYREAFNSSALVISHSRKDSNLDELAQNQPSCR